MVNATDITPTPKLRLPEFTDPYKPTKFTKLFLFSSGKNIKQKEASPSFDTPCVRYGELYHMYGEVIHDTINFTKLPHSKLTFSHGNEILLPSAGEDSFDIGAASALTVPQVAIGRTINILRPATNGVYSHVYMSFYVNACLRRKIAALAKGVSISNVYNSDLKTLSANIPDIKEQQQVANFLSAVNIKIQQLKRKSSLTQQYKKGVMQQLFSQQVRFKDDGQNYPDWEDKRLDDLFERVTRKNKKNCKNVLTISAQQGLINQKEYFNKSVSATDVTGYYLMKKGEFAYNKSYSKGYPLGAIKKLNRYEEGVVSTLYICFKAKENIVPEFYEQYFEGGLLSREIQKIAQEGARNHGLLNISVVEFFRDIVIQLPSVEEQQKIADFLESIDKKIGQLSEQINQAEAFKTGLLQQMFV